MSNYTDRAIARARADDKERKMDSTDKMASTDKVHKWMVTVSNSLNTVNDNFQRMYKDTLALNAGWEAIEARLDALESKINQLDRERKP